MTATIKNGLLLLGFILIIAPETHWAQSASNAHRHYLPVLKTANCNPKKGVALAYGWAANPMGQDMLCTGTQMRWEIQNSGNNRSRELQTWWDDCWPSTEECTVDYFADLLWLAAQTDYSQMITHNGYPVVKFLNEPDNASQAARSPQEAVELYRQVVAICPHCVFTLPAISAFDHFCDWPEREWLPFHDDIIDGGEWCWSRAFLAGLEPHERDNFEVCNVHHYYSNIRHELRRNIAPLEPADSLAAVVGCSYFVISEYGTCDPAWMTALTNAYNADERVIAFYAYTVNKPDNTCDVLMNWHTGQLTDVGRAFAEAGNN